jgi:hypothetical protein
MPERDRLSNWILANWERYQPTMLLHLRQQNMLEQTLHETAERFTDLLFDLTIVKNLAYHQAWELAINEILLPEESSSTLSPKTSLPATSASATPTG